MICLSSSVFVGCGESGGYGIYSAKVPQHGTQLDFSKIASPGSDPLGITHHDLTEQLFYTVYNDGIYKCDFNGSNNERVLSESGGK